MNKKLDLGEVKDLRLSYSSATLLQNCERKYHYYKVSKYDKDPDADDSTLAFDIGKAFHEVMEKNHHTRTGFDVLLKQAVKTHNCEDHHDMIKAMLLEYLDVHEEVGLTAVSCEMHIANDKFLGYIDVILQDPITKDWWITDLKTAARISDTLLSRLTMDTQLNLYCHFAEMVAGPLKLDIKKFRGARYRVTSKSKLKKNKKETRLEYIERMRVGIDSYDIEVPVELLQSKAVYEKHLELQKRSATLHYMTEENAKQNFSFCDSFFRPCEYWSRCYSGTFTMCRESLKLNSCESLRRDNMLLDELL